MKANNITIRPRHEIDILINGDEFNRGRIMMHPDYGALWCPAQMNPGQFSVEDLETIIKWMKDFEATKGEDV